MASFKTSPAELILQRLAGVLLGTPCIKVIKRSDDAPTLANPLCGMTEVAPGLGHLTLHTCTRALLHTVIEVPGSALGI